MNKLVLAAAGALALSAGTVFASDSAARVPRPIAVSKFVNSNPESRFYWTNGEITTVYGKAFGGGDTARQAADAFVGAHAGLFGVAPSDLVAGTIRPDGLAEKPLMPDRQKGGSKFTLVSYIQQRDGIPVFRADLRLLARTDAGNPIVLARSALIDIGNFRVDPAVLGAPNLQGAFDAAAQRLGGLDEVENADLVIWAGYDGTPATPTLAVSFVARVGEAGDANYQKVLYVADAKTGAILWSENQVHQVDVSGTVKANATTGIKAAFCEPEAVMPMPYARVAIGATVAFTDKNGNFTIPNAGSGAVTVVSGVRGRWFRVRNPTNDAPGLSMSVTPPGPANFVHNAANTDALRLSEVNAYIQANVVRDYALSHDPAFPTIANQSEFRTNVYVSGTCNAFYDGSSINFYAAGGGCPDTAFGDVVHHEYGHHMVSVAGSGQGQYGEGFGDLNGVIIEDQPILAYGFFNDCNSGLRTAVNTLQYPCNAEIHECGQLITGAFWDTRAQLLATEPVNYRTLLGDWAVNSVQVHTGDLINPQVTIDVLTLDDNDANITNGTPHYSEIAAGFGAHNLDAPPLDLLDFTYPGGRPSSISNLGGEMFQVQVAGKSGAVAQPNTGILHVDPENDGTYVQYAMPQVSANLYRAVFPAVPCGANVRYFVSAKTTANYTEKDPVDAPSSYYSAIAATSFIPQFTDNFQTDKGWTTPSSTATSGKWERGVPVDNGADGDPTSDYDHSGMCYLTGNAAGDSDVDAGVVNLVSPTFNASGGGEVYVSYARWFSTKNPVIRNFYVQVSNDNGSTWSFIEKVPPTSPEALGGWYKKTYPLSTVVPLTSTMKVRFQTADNFINASTVEAAVDDFAILVGDCSPPCPPDFNGDGFLTGDDLDEFVAAFEAGDPSADYDGDGFVSGDDYDKYIEDFQAGC